MSIKINLTGGQIEALRPIYDEMILANSEGFAVVTVGQLIKSKDGEYFDRAGFVLVTGDIAEELHATMKRHWRRVEEARASAMAVQP